MKFVFALPDGSPEEIDVVCYIGSWKKEEADNLNSLLQQETQPITYETVVKIYESCKAYSTKKLIEYKCATRPEELDYDSPPENYIANTNTINFFHKIFALALRIDPDFDAISRVKEHLDQKINQQLIEEEVADSAHVNLGLN